MRIDLGVKGPEQKFEGVYLKLGEIILSIYSSSEETKKSREKFGYIPAFSALEELCKDNKNVLFFNAFLTPIDGYTGCGGMKEGVVINFIPESLANEMSDVKRVLELPSDPSIGKYTLRCDGETSSRDGASSETASWYHVLFNPQYSAAQDINQDLVEKSLEGALWGAILGNLWGDSLAVIGGKMATRGAAFDTFSGVIRGSNNTNALYIITKEVDPVFPWAKRGEDSYERVIKVFNHRDEASKKDEKFIVWHPKII
ncbi:MAG TPA: hypothetical protein VJI46_05935 [Candidatus Nanoarchaeia archaeon]|nr:hypothetical protein [Candidatus Nanoarchaeia archaeon]